MNAPFSTLWSTLFRFSLVFLGLAVLCLSDVQATIWTVSNNPASPGQFTEIQAAIDSASVKDTVQIAGGPTDYSNFIANKQIMLIGPGYLNNSSRNVTVNTGTVSSDSVVIIGMRFNHIDFNGSSTNFVGSMIRDCLITGSIKFFQLSQNVFFINNYIAELIRLHVGGNFSVSSCDFRNNLIRRMPSSPITNVFINCQFSNNLFFDHSSSSGTYNLLACSNSIFENNIFTSPTISPTGGTSLTFINNLTFQTAQDTLPNGNNFGSGNLIGDPLFGNDLGFSSSQLASYLDADFNLQPGSPAINAGSDGTDIGITGGLFPFQMNQAPFLSGPEIEDFFIIDPSTIQLNGQLKFQFKAKTRN